MLRLGWICLSKIRIPLSVGSTFGKESRICEIVRYVGCYEKGNRRNLSNRSYSLKRPFCRLGCDRVVTVEGVAIRLEGDLRVEPGGALTLRGVELVMGCGSAGQCEIRVRPGGYHRGLNRDSGSRRFSILNGAHLTLRNVTLITRGYCKRNLRYLGTPGGSAGQNSDWWVGGSCHPRCSRVLVHRGRGWTVENRHPAFPTSTAGHAPRDGNP